MILNYKVYWRNLNKNNGGKILPPESMYAYDYIMSLLIHSFSWAFMIMLPLAWTHGFVIGYNFINIFLFNMIFHAIVDDMKANRHEINLIQTQILHLIQIGLTWLTLI